MFRVLLLFTVVLIAGCFPAEIVSDENFSSDYRGEGKTIHPEFSIFQFSADSAKLFVQINTNELLFIKQLDDTFRAAFQLYVRVVDNYQNHTQKDTARKTIHINKTLEGTGKRLCAINFPLPEAGDYLLECTIYDSNKKVTETDYIDLDNSSPQSRISFFIHPSGSPKPFFTNYISINDTFSVDYRSETSRPIFVRYYKREFEVPPPPHSFNLRAQFDYKADSVFTIQSGSDYKYCFIQKGIYHLQIDSANHEGATIYRFDSGFPEVRIPEELINPLRYITTRKEFEELNKAQNKKQAVDKFWLNVGGTQDRSRQLIKKYYSRVEKANLLFTSFTEGWRTDRGMIYLIFGNPNIVNKSSDGETWTYGEANSSQSITFNFAKVTNPFSDNDYVLSRYPAYETNWYHAVDTWLQGRVYNDF